MRLLLAGSTLLAAACVPQPHPDPAHPLPPANVACNAASGEGPVGRQASLELGAEARRLTGARISRFLRPGQIVTMEYRADRLNLHLDAQDKVERINCG